MNKAFTLIELLAVIIILAIVALIATPLILNVIENSQKSANQSRVELLLNGAELYYTTSMLTDPTTKFNEDDNIYDDIKTSGVKPEEGIIKINQEGKVYMAVYIDGVCYSKDFIGSKIISQETTKEECGNFVPTADIGYAEGTIKTSDMLVDGVVPIIIDETDSSVTVANTMEEWFNYENKEWANAVILNDGVVEPTVGETITLTDIKAYYVWIPRYEYQIFDTDALSTSSSYDNGEEQTIKINFVNTNVIEEDGHIPNLDEWYTHPAFTIDDGITKTEIPGFWVGKFELTGTTANPTVLPNSEIQTNINVSTFLNTIETIDGDSTKTDSHMLKNMEWGATAYLSYSKYGVCDETSCTEITINDNSPYMTGGNNYVSNIDQSTTANITGVYDMSGASFEFVMGVMNNDSNSEPHYSASGFSNSTMPNQKYYDSYMYAIDNLDLTRGLYGDATRETTNWYDDIVASLANDNSWFLRGGASNLGGNSGVFGFFYSDASANASVGTRAALWVFPK